MLKKIKMRLTMKENKIKIQPLMYIRGINIDKSIVILDEA